MAFASVLSQLRLPFTAIRESSRPTVTVGGRDFAVSIARHRRARRYVLRLADDDTLRLTVPRGASIAGGLRFVERQGPWIERERGAGSRHARAVDGRHRGAVPRCVRAAHRDGAATSCARLRDHRAAASSGQMSEAPSKRIWRALATKELTARGLELARAHGLRVSRVSVRNHDRAGAPAPRKAPSCSTGV